MIGIVMRVWPPRKINWFYGFRTHYSMRNLENWQEANRYYVKLLYGISAVSVLAGWLLSMLLIFPLSILVLTGFMLILFIASIVLTNEHLKRRYGKW